VQKEQTMQNHEPIQLDAVIVYQQAAMRAIHCALTESHGNAFADAFLHEHQHAVTKAVKTRLCGHSEAWLQQETDRMRAAPI